eukprot:3837980-Heterocapsa_arctica.AAC.1
MKKRKETQYTFMHVQTPKRGNITEAEIGIAQIYGSIARYFNRPTQEAKGSTASSSDLPPTEGLHPLVVTIPVTIPLLPPPAGIPPPTDDYSAKMTIASAVRLRYTEHPT